MNDNDEDLAALESILGACLRDLFLETFERRFGDPPDAIKERARAAHVMELKEWIPNIVSAETPEDIFVSDLERALAQFAAGLAKRNCGIDVGPVRGLADLMARLTPQEQGNRQTESP